MTTPMQVILFVATEFFAVTNSPLAAVVLISVAVVPPVSPKLIGAVAARQVQKPELVAEPAEPIRRQWKISCRNQLIDVFAALVIVVEAEAPSAFPLVVVPKRGCNSRVLDASATVVITP